MFHRTKGNLKVIFNKDPQLSYMTIFKGIIFCFVFQKYYTDVSNKKNAFFY